MEKDLHPYLILLPGDQQAQRKILLTIFGSEISFDIMKQIGGGTQTQKHLVDKLPYSNKTIIEYLKKFIELGILRERIYSTRGAPKSYEFTKVGTWFGRLIMYRKYEVAEYEELLEELTNTYLEHVIGLWLDLHHDHQKLRDIFEYNLSKLLKSDQIQKSIMESSVENLFEIHANLTEIVNQAKKNPEGMRKESKYTEFLKEFNEMFGLLKKKIEQMRISGRKIS